MPVWHTSYGRIAAAICYDGWFPEIIRMAAIQGADLLCIPTNWVPMPEQPDNLPVMANIFLHYLVDLWIQQIVKPTVKGYVEMVRYADDFLILALPPPISG